MSSNNSTQTTEESASTNDDATVRFEKDVLVTAYAKHDYDDKRTFMDDVFGEFLDEDTDIWAENTTEEEKVELTINFETEDPERERTGEFSESISPFHSSDRRLLKNAIETGMIDPDELDWLEADIRVEKETSYVEPATLPLSEMLDSVDDEIHSPEDFGFESRHSYVYDTEWMKDVEQEDVDGNADEDLRVRVNSCHSSDIQRRRVLTHQSERSADDRYETPEDVEDEKLPWSVQVTIHIETDDEDEMDAISEDLVTYVNSELALQDGIEKTRLTDCEKTKQEQGACYQF